MNYQNDNERSEMRLRSIWSLPSYPLKERLRRTRDWATGEIACNLPLRVRYFVTLQALGYATRQSDNIPQASLEYILNNLEAPKDIA